MGRCLLPLASSSTPPLVETPSSSAIVFRVEAVTFDLDLPEVFFTMPERLATFWALTQGWGIPLPIRVKHLEHMLSAFGGGDFRVLMGAPMELV